MQRDEDIKEETKTFLEQRGMLMVGEGREDRLKVMMWNVD